MNWAASNLEDREDLQKGIQKWKTFIGRRKWEKEGILYKKKLIGYYEVTFPQGVTGFYQADYLSIVDQAVSD